MKRRDFLKASMAGLLAMMTSSKEVFAKVGFTSTNHTAEDQLLIVYGKKFSGYELKSFVDNTELFHLMNTYMGFKYSNPKMARDEAIQYVRALTKDEWEEHLNLHIS